MPVYTWKGLNAGGKAVGGTRDADSAKGLRLVLRRDGIFVTEHREMLAGGGGRAPAKTATAGGAPVPFFKRDVDLSRFVQSVSPQEVAVFTRQLATLLRAGIPLAEALGALSEQSDNKRFEVVLTGVRQKVNEGSSLAETLGQHPKIFPEIYTNMVRSGEAAGNLDAVLARLADFLDAQHAAALEGLVGHDLPHHHDGARLGHHGAAHGGRRPEDHDDLRGRRQELAVEHELAHLPVRHDLGLLVAAVHRGRARVLGLPRVGRASPRGASPSIV